MTKNGLLKYQIPREYTQLSMCIKTGNLNHYMQLLEKNDGFLVDLGVSIIFIKLGLVCFRNMCRFIWCVKERVNQLDMRLIEEGCFLGDDEKVGRMIEKVLILVICQCFLF